VIGLFQLTGNISGMKFGLVKEGFGHAGAESDVEELVRQAGSCFQTHFGATVGEVSIPMHLDGKICSVEFESRPFDHAPGYEKPRRYKLVQRRLVVVNQPYDSPLVPN